MYNEWCSQSICDFTAKNFYVNRGVYFSELSEMAFKFWFLRCHLLPCSSSSTDWTWKEWQWMEGRSKWRFLEQPETELSRTVFKHFEKPRFEYENGSMSVSLTLFNNKSFLLMFSNVSIHAFRDSISYLKMNWKTLK